MPAASISPPPPFVGLVPAAGKARRHGLLPCSKELLPVGWYEGAEGPRLRVACQVLLERLRASGAREAFLVVDRDKGDIPRYLAALGEEPGVRLPALAFVSVADSPSVPETLDRAYPFLARSPETVVGLGFADVLFAPADAFDRLLECRGETGAALVLGLFPAADPATTDMVETGPDGAVRRIEVRPATSELALNWLLAVWDRRFTEHLHRWVAGRRGRGEGELQLGAAFASAVAEGLPVQGVPFPRGSFLDLATPRDLLRALRGEMP